MRTVGELKQRWLSQVRAMFARPEMYATDGRAMDIVAQGLLGDLCFLDDRDDDYERVMTTLRRFGPLGVAGPFAALFGRERQYTVEVASVYAEQFHRLGYLEVARLLDSPLAGLRDWVADRDVRRSEVEATLGAPSLVVGKRVLCYAPADGTGWVFVDCWDEAPRQYVPGEGSFDWKVDADPLVRDLRVPADKLEDGLILTLYGTVVRWGPG